MKTSDFSMTKIIATLGPATNSVDIISKLIEAGARVFRINFSHGSFDEFDEMLDKIRKAEKKTNTFVAVLGDLSGPKIRALIRLFCFVNAFSLSHNKLLPIIQVRQITKLSGYLLLK